MALYQGVEQNTDAQRQALLNAIAQQGQLGAQAYQTQSGQQNAAFRGAVASNAALTQGTGPGAPSGLLDKINAASRAQHDTYANDASLANTAFQNANTGISNANDAYFKQASAAVPAMREQTAGIVAQIRAEQEAAALEREERRKQAEYDAWMRELDRQAAEEERGFQREQWDFEREMMRRQLEAEATDGAAVSEEDRSSIGAAMIEARQNDILSRAYTDIGDAGGSLIESVIGTSTNVEDALYQASDIMDEEDATGNTYTTAARNAVLRHIYAYYNPTEPIPDDQALSDFLAQRGVTDVFRSSRASQRSWDASAARYAGQAAQYGRSRRRDPTLSPELRDALSDAWTRRDRSRRPSQWVGPYGPR